MDYPYNLTKEEVIRRIEQVYQAQADPTNEKFDVYDQLLACESIAEAEEEERKRKPRHFQEANINNKRKGQVENVVVSGMVNDTYKRTVNFELTESKLKAIEGLRECNYQTPPIKIAQLLEKFFLDYNTKEGHWLYVAQQWTPRAINRVINYMVKLTTSGRQTLINPPAYFTFLIKKRKKRKLTGINGA